MSKPDEALADRLATVAASAVEVGIGNRPTVAAALRDRGVEVTATDIERRSVPEGVEFVLDDVTDPEPAVYEGTDVVYARNLPPELHRPVRSVARTVGATCWFTTLGGDPPVVPVDPESLPGGVTLYRVTDRG
ncbi:UPF0146 family protein [Haloarcula sp. GH36]|uniref:UPF0146 family protein n=1 Tax=Haloarcula montana TaxID=3111776 RepID=UPI002D7A05B2|nr:UPF0146 family protein [Haloarcula sp. GH36]